MGEDKKDSNQFRNTFEVINMAKVSTEVVESAKKAVSMVWDKNVNNSTKLNLVFCTHLTDSYGKDIDLAGQYDPASDKIILAVDSESYNSIKGVGLDDKAAAVLMSAHETMHKVQFHRGEVLKPSELDKPDKYINDIHEQEAWNEALHVFKKLYPKSRGGFTLFGHRFEIPEQSKY